MDKQQVQILLEIYKYLWKEQKIPKDWQIEQILPKQEGDK